MKATVSCRVRAHVLAFVVLTALIRPPLSQATVIDVNLTFDLNNSHFGTGRDYPVYWDPGQYFYFPEVQPVAGDSLRFSMDFVDQQTNRPQTLKISELGIWETVEGAWGTAQGVGTSQGDISVTFAATNYFTFQDVKGHLRSNPVSNASSGGGVGVGTTLITDMTDKWFSFTGITWQIDFSQLTYYSGDAFSVMAIGLSGDRIEVEQPVPEPSTLLLLGSGLAGLAGIARKSQHR